MPAIIICLSLRLDFKTNRSQLASDRVSYVCHVNGSWAGNFSRKLSGESPFSICHPRPRVIMYSPTPARMSLNRIAPATSKQIALPRGWHTNLIRKTFTNANRKLATTLSCRQKGRSTSNPPRHNLMCELWTAHDAPGWV